MSLSKLDAASITLELAAGARVVLQRVPRGTSAAEVVSALATAGEPVTITTDPFNQTGRRLFDGRVLQREEEWAPWDHDRESLGTPDHPLIVLLDVSSGRALARGAPHLLSWAGGVRIPQGDFVRPARSDEELAQGEAALQRALAEDPEFAARHQGQLVAIDLLTRRLFTARPDAQPLSVASEGLDQGIVFLGRVP